jgi:hypothetical protein
VKNFGVRREKNSKKLRRCMKGKCRKKNMKKENVLFTLVKCVLILLDFDEHMERMGSWIGLRLVCSFYKVQYNLKNIYHNLKT